MKPKADLKDSALTNGSNEDNLFSEDALRQLCKDLTKVIPSDETEIDEHALIYLQSLYEGLLRTANSTKLSLGHGAAALNALCGFFEQFRASKIPELRDLAFSSTTWIKTFEIYLERSERNKAKPVRRLLLTLTDSLKKHPQEDVKSALTEHAVSRATRAIFKQHDTAFIRPAIQAIEHFIHVNVTTAQDIIDSIMKSSESPQATSEVDSRFLVGVATDVFLSQRNGSAEIFASGVLEWVQHPDCAPAAGRLLSTFFKSLTADRYGHSVPDSTVPLWVTPVKQAINRHPELLEIYEHHILPGLIRSSSADTRAFLKTLPLKDIERGNVGSIQVADIQLCILVARGARILESEKGTFVEHRDTSDDKVSRTGERKGVQEKNSPLVDTETLGVRLLEHASERVRVAALSLLVSSSVTSKPLSQRALDKLRVCIPYFHHEVNPRARNEFIALMKKLCLRVRCAIMSLLRAKQTSIKPGFEGSSSCKLESIRDNEDKWNPNQRLIKSHLAFRRWYLLFLFHELRPTAPYQSHITTLRILHCLIEAHPSRRDTVSKVRYEYVKSLDEDMPRALFLGPLFDLLLDPFDDVRQWTAKVFDILQLNLSQISTSMGGNIEGRSLKLDKNELNNTTDCLYNTVIRVAEEKAKITGRADHADGVGRLYELLFGYSRVTATPTSSNTINFSILEHLVSTTEREVEIANKDLLQAISNASLHGHLIALRYIACRSDFFSTLGDCENAGLKRWGAFIGHLHLICHGAWRAVRNILCYDAPEGHEVDEESEDIDLGTKDALSFCWRALKESSLLVHAIITTKGHGLSVSGVEILQYDDYHKFGYLCFTQLAELRHRGAFSTVSQTFSACCIACTSSSNLELSGLVEAWYHDALTCMERNASALTRRSAGIPAMITAILAAYVGHDLFNDAVLDLQAIADIPISILDPEDPRLPQVHALNSLKEIFTDARFGHCTEAHVANTIELAAVCLESQVWAIRNCGLMLFKALLRRLNGGTDTASTKVTSSHRRSSKLIYERYPNLPTLVLKLLSTELSSEAKHIDCNQVDDFTRVQAHKLFPAMEILERSGLQINHRKETLAAMWHFMESFDWSTREKGAKALSYILDDRDLISNARRLLSPDWPSQNALHGRLMCIEYLLSRSDIAVITYEELVPLISACWESMLVHNTCPITAAAYLNILADLQIILLQQRSPMSQSFFDRIMLVNRSFISLAKYAKQNPALALQSRALKRCLSLECYIKSLKKPLQQLGQSDIDIMVVLNEAWKNMSDENLLAVLRLVPPYFWHQPEIVRYADGSFMELSNNLHQADFTLAMSGYDIAISYKDGLEAKAKRRLPTWIQLLAAGGSESSELTTRAAAVYSLRGFFEGMQHANKDPRAMPETLGPFLMLYDTLVDDDEDVRDQGARTVSSLLSSHTMTNLSLSPPAAKSRLLDIIATDWRSSTACFVEAVRRLTGLPSMYSTASHAYHNSHEDGIKNTALQLRPVSEIALEAQTTEIAVFVEEKQNLYVDTVAEATEWSRLLVQMDAEAWDLTVLRTLRSWAVDGLKYLLELYELGDNIGALGPTSKPEMHTLFMRVILAARVLMTRPTPKPSEELVKEDEFRILLQKLLDLGRQMLVHSLLLTQVESLLADVRYAAQ